MLNINNVKNNLREVGYLASDELAKSAALFEAAGKRASRSIPAMLLEGPAGAGKTTLAESFAKMVGAKLLFLQCFPGMGSDSFIAEPNVAAIIARDSQNSIKDGILVRSLKETTDGPSVVILDELDKASPEVDSFLLDYLNSGRVSNGKDTWTKGDGQIWVFITSNKERQLSDALINRCRKVYVPRPSKELFLDILGIDKTDDKVREGWEVIYDRFPDFSIRQGKSYLEDLKELGIKGHDMDVLSQYISEKDMADLAACNNKNTNEEDEEEEEEIDLSQYETGICGELSGYSSEEYEYLIDYIHQLGSDSKITIITKDNYDENYGNITNHPNVYFRMDDLDVLIDIAIDTSKYSHIFNSLMNSYRYDNGLALKLKKTMVVSKYFEDYSTSGVVEYFNKELNIHHLFIAEKMDDEYYKILSNKRDILNLLDEVHSRRRDN